VASNAKEQQLAQLTPAKSAISWARKPQKPVATSGNQHYFNRISSRRQGTALFSGACGHSIYCRKSAVRRTSCS
jgi:hypothetical protein